MNDWEYKIIMVNAQHEPTTLEWITGFKDGNAEVQELLDSIGRDGWELVAFFPARPANQTLENSVTGQKLTIDANPWLHNAVFKKAAETSEEREQRIQSERLMRRIEEHESGRKD
jgi:hypothetical protein